MRQQDGGTRAAAHPAAHFRSSEANDAMPCTQRVSNRLGT